MEGTSMRDYWDRRAREDAFHFVDNRLEYGNPDLERFWAEGEVAVNLVCDELGVTVEPTDTVLEIGCGVGRLTRALAGRAKRAIGLDISKEMLALARKHNAGRGNIEWVLGDGTSLAGVEDSVANACISTVVFQHIPDPQITLGYVTELGRVLAPGGWAGIQISNDPSVHRPRKPLERFRMWVKARLGRAPKEQQHSAWLGSAIELDELRATAEAAGLVVERIERAGTQYCLVLLRRP